MALRSRPRKQGTMEPGVKTVAKRGPKVELTATQMQKARRRHFHPRNKRRMSV